MDFSNIDTNSRVLEILKKEKELKCLVKEKKLNSKGSTRFTRYRRDFVLSNKNNVNNEKFNLKTRYSAHHSRTNYNSQANSKKDLQNCSSVDHEFEKVYLSKSKSRHKGDCPEQISSSCISISKLIDKTGKNGIIDHSTYSSKYNAKSTKHSTRNRDKNIRNQKTLKKVKKRVKASSIINQNNCQLNDPVDMVRSQFNILNKLGSKNKVKNNAHLSISSMNNTPRNDSKFAKAISFLLHTENIDDFNSKFEKNLKNRESKLKNKKNEFARYLSHRPESIISKDSADNPRITVSECGYQMPPRPVMKNAEVQANDVTHIAKIIKMISGGGLVCKCCQKEKEISDFI